MTETEINEAAAREQSRVSRMTVGDFLNEIGQPHRRNIAVEIAAACMARVLDSTTKPVRDHLPPLPQQVAVRSRLDCDRAYHAAMEGRA